MVCNANPQINFHKVRLVTKTNFHTHHCEVNKDKWSEWLILTIVYKTSYPFFTKKATLENSTLNWIIFTKSRFFLNGNFKINWTNLWRNTSQSHNEKKSTKASFRHTFIYFEYIDLQLDAVSTHSNSPLAKLWSRVDNEVWFDLELLVIFPSMKLGDF